MSFTDFWEHLDQRQTDTLLNCTELELLVEIKQQCPDCRDLLEFFLDNVDRCGIEKDGDRDAFKVFRRGRHYSILSGEFFAMVRRPNRYDTRPAEFHIKKQLLFSPTDLIAMERDGDLPDGWACGMVNTSSIHANTTATTTTPSLSSSDKPITTNNNFTCYFCCDAISLMLINPYTYPRPPEKYVLTLEKQDTLQSLREFIFYSCFESQTKSAPVESIKLYHGNKLLVNDEYDMVQLGLKNGNVIRIEPVFGTAPKTTITTTTSTSSSQPSTSPATTNGTMTTTTTTSHHKKTSSLINNNLGERQNLTLLRENLTSLREFVVGTASQVPSEYGVQFNRVCPRRIPLAVDEFMLCRGIEIAIQSVIQVVKDRIVVEWKKVHALKLTEQKMLSELVAEQDKKDSEQRKRDKKKEQKEDLKRAQMELERLQQGQQNNKEILPTSVKVPAMVVESSKSTSTTNKASHSHHHHQQQQQQDEGISNHRNANSSTSTSTTTTTATSTTSTSGTVNSKKNGPNVIPKGKGEKIVTGKNSVGGSGKNQHVTSNNITSNTNFLPIIADPSFTALPNISLDVVKLTAPTTTTDNGGIPTSTTPATSDDGKTNIITDSSVVVAAATGVNADVAEQQQDDDEEEEEEEDLDDEEILIKPITAPSSTSSINTVPSIVHTSVLPIIGMVETSATSPLAEFTGTSFFTKSPSPPPPALIVSTSASSAISSVNGNNVTSLLPPVTSSSNTVQGRAPPPGFNMQQKQQLPNVNVVVAATATTAVNNNNNSLGTGRLKFFSSLRNDG
jgi:hypothetical protein